MPSWLAVLHHETAEEHVLLADAVPPDRALRLRVLLTAKLVFRVRIFMLAARLMVPGLSALAPPAPALVRTTLASWSAPVASLSRGVLPAADFGLNPLRFSLPWVPGGPEWILRPLGGFANEETY